MRFRMKRNHMIDFLFPVALFFVFALSALTLILLAARIYQSTTENSSLNYSSRTCLSYITEKIHQGDENGAVYLGSFDGSEALVMEQTRGEEIYYTYIYACDQELRELFVKAGVKAGSDDGKTILEIQDFTMEQVTDHLLRFSCIDRKNRSASTVIGIRSR